MALAGEAESREDARDLITLLGAQIDHAIEAKVMNPKCGICAAPAEDWTMELGRTRYATLEEAQPELQRQEAGQIAQILDREGKPTVH